jgi:hypothetical protein
VSPETDDLFLMNAKNPENSAGGEQSQVDEGAKSAIRNQDIALGQIRMNLADA